MKIFKEKRSMQKNSFVCSKCKKKENVKTKFGVRGITSNKTEIKLEIESENGNRRNETIVLLGQLEQELKTSYQIV